MTFNVYPRSVNSLVSAGSPPTRTAHDLGMSHSHTHAPGQNPGHTHGPTPQQIQQQQQQQAQLALRQPDPVVQAVIEASFQPVDVLIGGPDNVSLLCPKHSLEKCAECDVDYFHLNRLSRTLQTNPQLRCPPPPQVVNKQLTQAVTNMKEEGNTLFKVGQHEKAIQRYTMAANIAAQRAPWEAQQLLREEMTLVLSNRSAAYLEQGDYIAALVDAEVVIQLKRHWSKGHFRKARALLKMDRYEEAKDAISVGLSFEPESKELAEMLAGINTVIEMTQKAKAQHAGENAVQPPIPVS